MTFKNFPVRTVVALLVLGCSGTPAPSKPDSPPVTASAGRTILRVSLFPWIPNAESLFRWIERDFEERHPDIDLVVREAKQSHDGEDEYVADLAYEYDKTTDALTKDGPDAQDLIEIDTMILGRLVATRAVAPFTIEPAAFLQFAKTAVTVDGKTYGVPHWTCGYFVISEIEDIVHAKTSTELLEILAKESNQRVDLVGDLDGSWDAVMVYLDALRDTDPGADMKDALEQNSLHPQVARSLKAIGSACAKDGNSLCGSNGVDMFASGDADALIGYSERLHPILEKPDRKVGELHIASAPLGDGDNPTLFTDALVLSPRCTGACRDAAEKFAIYYVSDAVFDVALLARDAGTDAVPRYLLPSTTTAFETDAVAANRLYRQLRGEIENAHAYPNDGVPQAREHGTIRKLVKEALGIEP